MTTADCIDLTSYIRALDSIDTFQWTGEVSEMVGMLIESRGPAAAVGSFCEIETGGGKLVRTQVVGFRNGRVLSIPLEEVDGLQLGDRVVARDEDSKLGVGMDLLG